MSESLIDTWLPRLAMPPPTKRALQWLKLLPAITALLASTEMQPPAPWQQQQAQQQKQHAACDDSCCYGRHKGHSMRRGSCTLWQQQQQQHSPPVYALKLVMILIT
jgi:hypothetical protein